ncbi:hypothetical protein BKA63DRAFT_564984 [Paraphoma chrysanthemicola]|nr:hypothetical protein BKA63DRAFT_564984 [Paraphoma chrysanthemicola]
MSTATEASLVTHDDPISDFISKYKRETRRWQDYLNYTMSFLETAVKEEAIPSMVAGRVKKPEKVEGKLRKKHSFYRYACEKHILNNLVDFVGLRISAYFPDDQKNILRLINKKFVIIASVSFTDDRERYDLNDNVSDAAGKDLIA